MLCSRCGKNPAMIFMGDEKNPSAPPQALCISCARELGIHSVDNIIKQMGLDPEQVETGMQELMENMGDVDASQLATLDENDGANPMDFLNKVFQNFQHNDKNTPPEANHAPEGETQQSKERVSPQEKKAKKKRKYLETYGINLTRKAADGGIDRVVGRGREIGRVIQVLNRRSKNNPVLLGEPGVGKTAIAEGLALRIVEKQVPAKLFGCEVYLLDFAALVAGTQFRGQFESRLKGLIEEVKQLGNIILVIDEIHNIVGAGEAEGGAMNAANIMKPALARGEIQIIGATTLEEYRKKIEKDSALERRFQPVMVDEPSVEDSIEILKGIKGYYEDYHKVSISDEVVKSAVLLSERYIHDRFLPDKAIDVIDEAASKVNLANEALLEISRVEFQLKDLEAQREGISEDDFQKIADLKSLECRCNEKLQQLKEGFHNTPITVEDVAQVVEMWTKIPVQKLTEVDSQKLLSLEENLHKRVIGQNKAVESVSRAVRRKRAGFVTRKRPVSFIFVGPTGVGKTELVKALSSCMFGSEEALVRLDMSEYMEKHSVSKLIGSPPGYVGYDEAGQLTEKIRRNPYSIILLDEIEKAHADVFNIFLQILDDGRITDSQGRVVNFENTVIVMTSNAGSELNSGSMGFESSQSVSKYEKTLNQLFRPEFLNRVDEVVEFAYLTREELLQVTDLMLEELKTGLSQQQITMEITQSAKELIVDKGYQRKFGARPMRRVIMKEIEDVIAERIINGSLKKGQTVEIGAEGRAFLVASR